MRFYSVDSGFGGGGGGVIMIIIIVRPWLAYACAWTDLRIVKVVRHSPFAVNKFRVMGVVRQEYAAIANRVW